MGQSSFTIQKIIAFLEDNKLNSVLLTKNTPFGVLKIKINACSHFNYSLGKTG
jgi:hypothetical protein